MAYHTKNHSWTEILADKSTTRPPASQESATDISNLFPALVECFVIILIGYGSGRFGFIPSSQSKGIGWFVSHIALPALLFKSMVVLDFESVNWKFLAAILLAKGIVFFVVAVFTVLLAKPNTNKYGKAGIFAIFATQSNDFAVGFPLVMALYQKSMPEYLNYIYLLAPVSLVCLNPIGFIFLEFSRQRTQQSVSKIKLVFATIKGVVTNPIVGMTFVGILGNFILKRKVPVLISGFLDVLGQSFFAAALFFLGLKMVGNMRKQLGYGLIVPFLLIFAKILLLPLLAREFVQILNVGHAKNDTDSWSMFGFLYGTFPSAPTVVIFASKYGVEEEMIASSMVLGTFVSAPMMYISARMATLKYTHEVHHDYNKLVFDTMSDASSVGIPCGVWVIAMFMLGRHYKIHPQRFTLCLVISQVVFCISVIFSKIHSDNKYWHVVLFFIHTSSCLACRCWMAAIAFTLCAVRCSAGRMKRLLPYSFFFGFGLPVLLAGIKLCFVNLQQPAQATTPYLLFLQNQIPVLAMDTSVVILCTVIIVVSLVKLQRCDVYCKCPGKIRKDSGSDTSSRCYRCQEIEQSLTEKSPNQITNANPACNQNTDCCSESSSSRQVSVCDIESIDESTCLLGDQKPFRRYSESLASSDGFSVLELALSQEEYYEGDKHQLGRHVVMLVIYLLSICLCTFLSLWYLLKESRESGIYIALRELDTILTFGQSFIVFACFGLEKQLIIIPFLKRWRRFWYGAEDVTLTPMDQLDADTIHSCEQFKKHHKLKCKRALVSDKRYRLRMYKNVFRGNQLVDWLLDVGLAEDRQAAVHYGNSLMLGRILQHVTKEHFFYDMPYYYRFL